MDPTTENYTVLTAEAAVEDAESLAAWAGEAWGMTPSVLERPDSDVAWMELFFDDQTRALLARDVLKARPDVRGVALRQLASQDWEAMWKTHFHRQEVGARLEVCPSWEAGEPCAADRERVLIHPGMSFGTGEHFTTRFCLEMIDELCQNSRPATLLDVGTGSGILAIAARKLGVPNVVGLDSDDVAIARARENAARNGVDGGVEWRVHDVTERPLRGRYDVVCANLYGMVLMEVAPALARVTGAHLVLSGIRDLEVDGVAEAFRRAGLAEVSRDGEGEWTGLLFGPENKDGV